MYNAKAVILGILVFAVLFSTPFWANFGGTKDYKRPAIVLPQNEKECVEPVEFMRAEHMYLLNEWRDQALRYENRTYVSSTGLGRAGHGGQAAAQGKDREARHLQKGSSAFVHYLFPLGRMWQVQQ